MYGAVAAMSECAGMTIDNFVEPWRTNDAPAKSNKKNSNACPTQLSALDDEQRD